MLIFVDETGDHDLVNIDPQYPLFGLGAILIEENEYLKMAAEVKINKREFFKDDVTFILHSSELKRPRDKRSDRRNSIMLDPKIRSAFYQNFDERIIKSKKFKVTACFIRKQTMADKYVYPADPYHFSFENLLNRIIRYGNGFNAIHTEKRGPELDTELLSEYERLTKVGIHSYSAETLSAKTTLKLINKKENMNGLQVIDLILSCLARKGMGKKDKMVGNDLNPRWIETKLACPPTIFPGKKK